MLIRQHMTRPVITVEETASVLQAKLKMSTHEFRHLPVVDFEQRLIGIVTDRDIRSALPFRLNRSMVAEEEVKRFGHITIADIMTRDPYTLSAQDTLQDALLLFQKIRVGAFPVIEKDGKVVGIISERDLLGAFIGVLGIGEPGTLIGILIDDRKGQIKGIVDMITGEGIAFGSILVARHWGEGRQAVFPYLLTQKVGRLKRQLKDRGYRLIEPKEWHLD
jgi:acetoin utilization protein AcuB